MTPTKRSPPSTAELVDCGLSPDEAAALRADIEAAWSALDPLERWRRLCGSVLRPEQPWALHVLLHRRAFADWPADRGPAPAWVPSDEVIAASNLGSVMEGDYAAYYRRSIHEPETYWAAMLSKLRIVAHRPPDRILDLSAGAEHARWLPGMKLNIAESVLERDPGRTAVIWRRPGGPLERRTLGELREDCLLVARGLAAMGLGSGDAVAIDMPMTYPSVVIYLAIVMSGAVVVSIADSFAAGEIATRLRIAGARAIFTQDVILRGEKALPLYARVVEAGAPRAVVLPAGEEPAVELRPGDLDWRQFCALAERTERAQPYVIADVEAPTNILFSSGTTGEPKAIVWNHATPIKCAADGWAHHDIRPGDAVCWPTNIGWMMGPWLIYASLLCDAALVLYLGAPQERGFGELVRDARVTMLGVVPSLVRTWRKTGCMDGLDWSAIRCFSSTGEASNADDMHWLMSRAGYRPVIEYCGGTEIGGGYITGTVVQPQVPAAFSTPALGCEFCIIDEQGREADAGEVALVPPLFGSSSRLLNADHHEVYFAGMPRRADGRPLRRHGDYIRALGGGYYRAEGRVDDTMNLGGIKTSSAEIERAVSRVEGVVESAAVAVPPPGGGPSLLVIYAVADPAARIDEAGLREQMTEALRQQLNPLFKIHEVVIVEALPRTASGKVMRRVLRDRYQDERRG